jgi:hypothetical protein
MDEQNKTFVDLTAEEFQQVLTYAASPDFHDLTMQDFFTALAAIAGSHRTRARRSERCDEVTSSKS